MSRTTLDQAVAAVLHDRARHDRAQPRGEAPRAHVGRGCSRCGTPGHYAKTCTADVGHRAARRGCVAKRDDDAPRATPAEIAQLNEVIALQHSALTQHQSAVRHWLAAGDVDRADAARWREDYVSGLLVQLRIDRAALCAAM